MRRGSLRSGCDLPLRAACRRLARRLGICAAGWLVLAAPRAASADEATNDKDPALLAGTSPPAEKVTFVQYGVSFTGELVAAPGPICDDAVSTDPAVRATETAPPCILGGGGGVAFRLGFRGSGPWYFGGAYEISKQDPNKLYRLAILQQLRAEARYYVDTEREWQPYAGAGLGLAGYGDEWTVDTWGPATSASIGAEWQLTRTTLLGFGLTYRLIHTHRFVDSSRTERAPGFSQIVGIELSLEGRDAL
jgi:opacity protein-like surface antigen